MKVSCGHCSELHDVSRMEPAYALPDCLDGSSLKDAIVSKDVCAIRDAKRGFLRLLLPIPVEGEGPCNWGVWVELDSYTTFMGIVDAWTDPSLLGVVASAKLANELLSYPGSLGLPGIATFLDIKSVGRFNLLHPLGADMKPLDEHPLVRDQRDGVSVARKLEWLLRMLHS